MQEPMALSRINWEETALRAVALRRRTAALVFCLSFLLLTAVILMLPKRYKSEMKLLVKNERQDLVVSPDNNSSGNRITELTETQVNSEIELIKSHDVLRNVVLRSGLAHEPGTIQAAGGASPIALANSVSSLEHSLEVDPVKKSDIIDVFYSAKTPELASSVLNQLASDYMEAHLKIHAAPGTYSFFEQQTASFADQLRTAEDQLRQFRERYTLLAMPQSQEILIQRAVEVQGSLEEADTQLADYQRRVARNQAEIATLAPRVTSQIRTVPQAALVQQLTTMQAQLENRRTELLTKFRPEDRLVKEVDNELASTRNALDEANSHQTVEQQTDINQIRQEAEKSLVTAGVMSAGLEARRSRLQGLTDLYKTRMQHLATASIDEEQLVRKVKENETNYLLYAKKKEEARIAESLDQQRITNVAMIESPTTPVKPFSPNVKLDLVIALLLAGLISFVTVLLLEMAWPSRAPVIHVRPFATAAAAAGD